MKIFGDTAVNVILFFSQTTDTEFKSSYLKSMKIYTKLEKNIKPFVG